MDLVVTKKNEEKIEWMNKWLEWNFWASQGIVYFHITVVSYVSFRFFFFYTVVSLVEVCVRVCLCSDSDCAMTKLSHFIQFTCVWTLNIHLDGLSVILFFYYISDNNAILKIFSNSVLLGAAHTCTLIRTYDRFISHAYFSVRLLNLKSDTKWTRPVFWNWWKRWGWE